MGDIVSLNEPTYLLIPLDEKPFEIDANSRAITVPSDFVKCGAVRSDNLCEIATFRIARYYDFQDLADCEIAIQWINADGQEGLSMAFGMDVESEPGYIRFGWAITEAVTAKAGNVKLAVRFYRKDEETGKLAYVLNTLSTSIAVKDTLSVNDAAEGFVKEENVFNLFNKVVVNGQNPMYAVPAQPSFAPAGGGIDFEQNAQAAIKEDNTLDLSVMAVTKDNSAIDYEWFYIPSEYKDEEGESVLINLTSNPEGLTAIGYDTSAYEINNKDFVLVDPIPEVKTLAIYYVKGSNGEMTPYDGEWTKEELAGKELYVKCSTLSFTDGDYIVTGQYYAKATSSLIEVDDGYKNPNKSEAESSTVSVLPPNPMVIKDNLPEHAFKGADLSFTIEEDPRKPAMSYKWERKASKDGDFAVLLDVTDPNYNVKEVGWYRATAGAKLNRTELEKVSEVCFVTEEAVTPEVSKYEYSLDKGATWIELTENMVINPGDEGAGKHEIWVRITVNEEKLTEFNSDKDNLTYDWRISYGDRGVVENITKDLIEKNDTVLNTTEYGTNIVKVFQDQDDDAFSLYCVITNTFQGQSKSMDTFDANRPFSIA